MVEKWKFLDFHNAMKILEMPDAEFYTNGAFLSNILQIVTMENMTQQIILELFS